MGEARRGSLPQNDASIIAIGFRVAAALPRQLVDQRIGRATEEQRRPRRGEAAAAARQADAVAAPRRPDASRPARHLGFGRSVA